MDVQPGQDVAVDDDVRYLERLGYRQQLSRVMGIWPNFALGFTYLSPVVGIYTLFAYALATAVSRVRLAPAIGSAPWPS